MIPFMKFTLLLIWTVPIKTGRARQLLIVYKSEKDAASKSLGSTEWHFEGLLSYSTKKKQCQNIEEALE